MSETGECPRWLQSIAFNLSLLRRAHAGQGGGACGSAGWALVTSHPGACRGRLIYKCSCEMVFNKEAHPALLPEPSAHRRRWKRLQIPRVPAAVPAEARS